MSLCQLFSNKSGFKLTRFTVDRVSWLQHNKKINIRYGGLTTTVRIFFTQSKRFCVNVFNMQIFLVFTLLFSSTGLLWRNKNVACVLIAFYFCCNCVARMLRTNRLNCVNNVTYSHLENLKVLWVAIIIIIIIIIIIVSEYLFAHIAVETLGPMNTSASQLFANLGRKISSASGDDREGAFRFCRESRCWCSATTLYCYMTVMTPCQPLTARTDLYPVVYYLNF